MYRARGGEFSSSLISTLASSESIKFFKLSPLFVSWLICAGIFIPDITLADRDWLKAQDGRLVVEYADCNKAGSVQFNLNSDTNSSKCDDINNYAVAIGWESAARLADSIAIGRNAEVRLGGPENDRWTRSIVVGAGSIADGQQATVLGSSSAARSQATAVGNDVYAVGGSSIAIGNDDITDSRYQDKLPEATINNIYSGIWAGANPLLKYGGANISDDNTFYRKYIRKGSADQRIYSPTLAGKFGAIAIGSRSVAGGEVSTALGSLSFALADRSTAVGIRTYVDIRLSEVQQWENLLEYLHLIQLR